MSISVQDIINKGKVSVRSSGTLYPVYISLFKEAFGFEPECPTCGSVNGHSHWDAFVAYGNGLDPNKILTTNINLMTNNKTFAIKNKSIIYSYDFKKEGQDRLFTNRTYGDIMTEEFAIAYLENAEESGDEELFDRRKAEFSKLPAKYATETDLTDVDLHNLKFAELQNLATSKNYPSEEWQGFKSKADMITYIEGKELGDDLI